MAILKSSTDELKVSCIHSDKKLGTWWALGTKNQWVEIRTTRSGKIVLFGVRKGRHHYFTLEKPKQKEKS